MEKVGYIGELYCKATLDMVIYKEICQLLLRYQFNKDFSAKIVSGQMLTGDIQVIVKKILQCFLECWIEM